MSKLLRAAAVLALGAISTAVFAQITNRHGQWIAQVYVDKMTDRVACSMVYFKESGLLIRPNSVVEWNLKRWGGPVEYQYRIDARPALDPVAASAREKELGDAHFAVPPEQLVGAQTLLLRVKTLNGGVQERSIDLVGLEAARAALLANPKCGPA